MLEKTTLWGENSYRKQESNKNGIGKGARSQFHLRNPASPLQIRHSRDPYLQFIDSSSLAIFTNALSLLNY
ncbi:hypothetical protein AKJ45_02900 [candidate division MSBL1 archaeon SCGC-AAA261F19]|uniref:Uncharacterized protein n=2 Tax=candidate division MSBL1 TaxID=215777 RepID=A0A133V971_9EURY|nr:hypothetical protein AKJ43_00775 [candidate division MSBL1 archaeon SCGC-AAA261D19]KXB02986.1 hypothetical protein AKJ45_02900 [candidate division MSBL1 archaeon SCGC-AAA261F19]